MTFAAFMEAALYGPGGYYAERPALGGPGGDYVTSPEIHPAFGALVGRQVAEVWEALGQPDRFELVEQGPGTGALCRDLLTWAKHEAPSFAPTIRYVLVEPSAPLRAAQRATLAEADLLDARLSWDERSALEFDGSISGCILANELVDAFPVHLVVVRDGHLRERYVALKGDGSALTFQEDEPSTPALGSYFDELGLLPGEGCLAEVNLLAPTWAERAGAALARGALLTIDYGYPASRLYAPDRKYGTLLCYRGHQLGSDPLVHVGEQDITSHVDFTTLARAGERVGLETAGLIDQAGFLTNLGLRHYLRQLERGAVRATEYDANRRALLELVAPEGLGAMLVLMQTRGIGGFRPSGIFGPASSDDSSWLPLLRPNQMRLPGPLEAEGILDVEEQWRELWGEPSAPER
jgi:SAM-dependent MidA family methyltransferase